MCHTSIATITPDDRARARAVCKVTVKYERGGGKMCVHGKECECINQVEEQIIRRLSVEAEQLLP